MSNFESSVSMEKIQKFYNDLVERLNYLETTTDNDVRLGKLTELQSVIIELQTIMLSELKSESEEIEVPEEIEIPAPIGDFIIENSNGVMGNDGMYYHYSDVCKLLKLYKQTK